MSSFWIPELCSQIYAMAGMQTQLHLLANQTGDFEGKDTEINGAGFSGMKFVARSVSQGDFDAWMKSVKSSSNILNLDTYNKLAAPSQNNPPAYYASVDKGLYNSVMMKFMMPMTQTETMHTSTSSSMDMSGMNMSGSSDSSLQTSLESPDKSTIISYDNYDGYAGPQKPATTFIIKNIKTDLQQSLPFFIPATNVGRYIEQWSWIDNRYVLISGDGLISILDTAKLRQEDNLIGENPMISSDKKTLTYTEIEPPLYGAGSGKTQIKSVALPHE